MNITLRQLHVFLELFETRSFTTTAEHLHMTQSAVSKMVAELESQLGFALFERTTRRVEPNDAAREFLGFAVDVAATMRSAARSVAELADLKRGRIGIAASPMMIYGLLAGTIAAYRRQHPGIHFDLHELSTDEAVDSVRTGQVDFGLGAMDAEPPGLETEVVFRDRMFVAMPRGHALARRRVLRWRDLARWDHISLRPLYSVRRTLDAIVAQDGVALPSSIEAGTLTATLGLVRAGAGITVLPGYAARVAEEWGIQVVAIHDLAPAVHQISVLRRRGAQLSLAARNFLEVLRLDLSAAETVRR